MGQRRTWPFGQAPSPVQFVWSTIGEPNALDVPSDLAADAQGSLYVVDAGNNRIRVFDTNSRFVAMWGKAGSGQPAGPPGRRSGGGIRLEIVRSA